MSSFPHNNKSMCLLLHVISKSVSAKPISYFYVDIRSGTQLSALPAGFARSVHYTKCECTCVSVVVMKNKRLFRDVIIHYHLSCIVFTCVLETLHEKSTIPSCGSDSQIVYCMFPSDGLSLCHNDSFVQVSLKPPQIMANWFLTCVTLSVVKTENV